MPFVRDVVLRSTLGIAQNLVRLVQRAELGLVSRSGIVRVKALCEKSIDAMDRLGLRVGTDLQRLVMVRRRISGHQVRYRSQKPDETACRTVQFEVSFSRNPRIADSNFQSEPSSFPRGGD